MRALDGATLADDWKLLAELDVLLAIADEAKTETTEIPEEPKPVFDWSYKGTSGRVREYQAKPRKKERSKEGREYDPITGQSLERDSWYARGHGAGRSGKPVTVCPKAPASHAHLEEVWCNGWEMGRIKGISEGKIRG